MADITGTNGNDDLRGNARGESDNIFGGRGDDRIQGFSGDDYLSGGRGNDLLIGGVGSDVMAGGLDADTFQFSAGHITQGAVDWITDFSFNQNDALSFRPSDGGQNIEILSATAAFVSNETFNGFDLNNSDRGRELVLEVRNTVTGNVQQIVLIDSYSTANDAQWQSYLSTFGYNGGIAASLDTITL